MGWWLKPWGVSAKKRIRGKEIELECANRVLAEMEAASQPGQQQQQQQQQQARPSTEENKRVNEGGDEGTPLRFDTGAAAANRLAGKIGTSLTDGARWKSLGVSLASGVRSNMVPSGLKISKIGRAMMLV